MIFLNFHKVSHYILSYLNVNTVCNKFSGLTNLVFEHVNILIVTEAKLYNSPLTAQFLMSGFHKTFRLDVTVDSEGLLVYVKGPLLARKLKTYKISFDIQATSFEINLRKEKWLRTGINKPPSRTDSQYTLNILADSLDVYSMQYDNKVVLGDFNLKSNNPITLHFVNDYDFTNFIKRSTCFYGDDDIDFAKRK